MTKDKRKDTGGGVALLQTNDATNELLDRQRVAERAYELYLARGATDGQAMDDWLRAERELTDRER
jgi:Protein of unknown function (DUF2934)